MAEPTSANNQAPAPGTPSGGTGPAPVGIPQPAMAAAKAQGPSAGVPMVPPHVQAMMPRPYPHPEQMFRPVGMAAVMQMQMMQQQQSGNQRGSNQQSGGQQSPDKK